jgi:hypothetical protein
LVIVSVSRFSVGFGWASEFEVFPQAATLPQEEETTGELLTLVTVIFLQQGFAYQARQSP